MKLLVTGAGGHIGIKVAEELLSHGYEVRALDMRPMPKELREKGAEVVYGNIADPVDMLRAADGCEGMIHLAAIPAPFGHGPLLDTNIKGTYNALDAAHAAGMERAIITSSIGALGFSFPVHRILPDYLPIDVNHPRRPQDVYGLSKEANENTAAMFARRYGMTTIAIRPPYVFDLHRAAQGEWLERRLQNSAAEVQNHSWGFWSYIDINDLARLFRQAWEAPLEPGHHIFYGIADDILSRETPRALIEKFLPELISFADKVGSCFYDLSATKEKLGFQAEITWRKAQSMQSGSHT